jgi:hypothetical protein
MAKVRRSTPKYKVVYHGETVYGPACKTDCNRFAARCKSLTVVFIETKMPHKVIR